MDEKATRVDLTRCLSRRVPWLLLSNVATSLRFMLVYFYEHNCSVFVYDFVKHAGFG